MSNKRSLDYVIHLIKEIAPRDVSDSVDTSYFTGRWISMYAEGTLFLSEAEGDKYSEVLGRLEAEFGKSEMISQKTIENALTKAIFLSIDIPKKRQDSPFEARMKSAITELRDTLTRPGQKYECTIPLGDVEPEGLPFRFGQTAFFKFSEHQLRKLLRRARQHQVSDEQIKSREFLVRRLRESNVWNEVSARTEVIANDYEAAHVLAEREMRITFDCLNFFSNLIPYNFGWIYFPEETKRLKSVSVVTREDSSFTLSYQAKGPYTKFSFAKVRSTKHIQAGLKKIDRLLRKAPRTELDQLIITAIQWAGRATTTRRLEEAFLLFAISLESIVLPNPDPKELSYRLRIRVAHLLGRNTAERTQISKEISDLYSIRSHIVHNGSYQVTENTLSRLEDIVKRTILAIIASREVSLFGKKKELDQWFEEKVLS